MPKISVIIPAYNEEKYIAESIESVLKQDLKNFEIILVNDNSTDNTKEIIEKFVRKDSKVKLLNHKKNKGRAAAVNTGIKKAKGKYIAFLDADDLMAKGRLKKQMTFLENRSKTDMIFGDFLVLKENKKLEKIEAIDFSEDPKKILLEARKRKDLGEIWPYKLLDYEKKEKFIPGGSVMVRKKVFNKIKLDENLKNSEDYDLWFKIIGKDFKIKKFPIITFIYRKHGEQKSKNIGRMKEAARVINKKLKKGKYFTISEKQNL